ncbi:Phosphate transporter 4,2 [Hibiscus syriacus]|uniref:Phosphate transporter 4,2 n=1 Tax=Hibiscus syriacus TaxID=106335 RepID=A0A6A2WLL8_HIBSY|nr:Phosphate transporter 4,2 [Hibiscus syriacus]
MKTNRKLKKSDPSSSKLLLKEIIGLTTKNANGLASTVSTSSFVYVAGCVAVVYDAESGTQSHLMLSHRIPKPLCCVAMSRDGRFVAAGESGPQPSVLVWDSVTHAFISELKGKHLVSVGGYIYLWDWRSGILVTKLKASSSCSAVTSVTFSSDANYVVTAGKKHLKFWAVGSSFISVSSAIWKEDSVVNCDQVDELFPIYALTDAGVLCLIDSGLSLRNSVDLKVEKGFALCASSKLIACACSNGQVQLFNVHNLGYVGSLLYSKAKSCHGEIDPSCHKSSENNCPSAPTLPDAVACQFISEKLVVVYGDHSLHIWNFHQENEATRSLALISHSACIWDIKNLCCEKMHDPSLTCAAKGCSGGISFATCSADGTVRLWDLVSQPDLSRDTADNIYLITESEGINIVTAGSFEITTGDTSFGNQGLRSMAISSDGKYMAVGGCEGNLHIYDLHNSEYTCIKDSHDAEILSLSFSLSSTKDIDSGGNDNHYLLASGGRDRIIHLYDVKRSNVLHARNFELIESIDDHSAAVTSIQLACNGCKILSCSADRSLVFRDVHLTDSRCKVSRRHHQMASNGTVYDMSVDPVTEVVVTVGQDKKINIFDISSGKLIRSFKQNKDLGDPIKVTMDPSGSYFVCSFSNKSICVYDFISGEMTAQAVGHGEVVTGVIFLPDCKHIVSVGGDGCIFVWKLPTRLASRMLQKVKETSLLLSPRTLYMPVAFTRTTICGEENKSCSSKISQLAERCNQHKQRANYHGWDSQETYAFRLSISRLPKWAQDKVTSTDFVRRNLEITSPQQMQVDPKISSPLISSGEDYGSLSHEHQTASDRCSGGSNSCLSDICRSASNATTETQSSASPDKLVRSSAAEDHWFTVYNVHLDLLDSPEVQNFKDIKMPVSSPKLVQGLADEMPNESEHSLGHRDHFIDDEQSAMDVNTFHVKSEDSDLFKEHFGNLSATLEVEKRQSSTRRRYSSQYFVRRDYLVGCKRLFNPFMQKNESTSNITLEEVAGSIDQDLNCSVSLDEKDEEGSSTIEEESEAPKQHVNEQTEVQEKITACKEALISLDIAAENVFKLFTKLRTETSMEESSSGSRVELYDEAKELMPKIAEKINSIAKVVQNNTTSDVASSTFEPLLGTLAESLSQRVVEIVKQNLSSV